MARVLALFASLAMSLGAPGQSVPAPAPVTFSRDVAPILYARCTSCHRPGQIAPMSLLTYEAARPWARSMRRAVSERRMPPWFADPHIGRFSNDSSLSDREIDIITRWADSGAPQGDPSDLPPAPQYNDAWHVGTPDLVLSIPRAFAVPASGLLDYQYFDVPTGLTEDRWVQALEVRPGDRRVVHHVTVFVRHPGASPQPPPGGTCAADVCGDVNVLDGQEVFTGAALGTLPEMYPPGAARLLKAGSVLRLQIHYTTIGTPTTDQTRIGFMFAKEKPAIALEVAALGRTAFVIPPHAANFALEANLEFRADATIWSLGAHNHLRGRSWRFDLIEPDGSTRTLLALPKYDFHWQLNYLLAPPLDVRRGSRLRATAIFDNSAANPANPDPNAEVRYGDQTKDEMMLSMVVYSVRR